MTSRSPAKPKAAKPKAAKPKAAKPKAAKPKAAKPKAAKPKAAKPKAAARVLGGLGAALDAVSKWLTGAGVGFAVIGGVAASLRGHPRLTKDVDVVANAADETWGTLVHRAAGHGLFPRVRDALSFARITRVLLLVHRPSRIEVDVSFGMLPFELEVVSRARTVRHGRLVFPLATAEDLVVMKALALRPRDVADIEGIVDWGRHLAGAEPPRRPRHAARAACRRYASS